MWKSIGRTQNKSWSRKNGIFLPLFSRTFDGKSILYFKQHNLKWLKRKRNTHTVQGWTLIHIFFLLCQKIGVKSKWQRFSEFLQKNSIFVYFTLTKQPHITIPWKNECEFSCILFGFLAWKFEFIFLGLTDKLRQNVTMVHKWYKNLLTILF